MNRRHFLVHCRNLVDQILYSRKFSSVKNFVKSDRQAVRQEFIFVKCRSSLVCSSIVRLSLFCLSFIFPFMKAFLIQHLWLLKKLVRNLISSKNCFDESDEVKFLTKISYYTVGMRVLLCIAGKKFFFFFLNSQKWPMTSTFFSASLFSLTLSWVV